MIPREEPVCLEDVTPTGRDEDEERLLRRFLAGDAASAKQVQRWAREIIHHRYFYIPRDEHDDLIQDTVVQVWAAACKPDFVLRRGLRALVRMVAAARCIDRIRRRRPLVELDGQSMDPRPGPYDELERRDEHTRLRMALQTLSEPCREVVRLRFFENLSYDEMAARLGRKAVTLRVRLFNCVRDLRRMLD